MSETPSDCDPAEDFFQDARENIKTSSDFTDSDDKLSTDFELLGISSPDDGAKSPTSECVASGTSSVNSWDKCDASDIILLEESIVKLEIESSIEVIPIAHSSRDVSPKVEQNEVSPELPQDAPKPKGAIVKTTEEWKSIVEKYKVEKQLDMKLKEVQMNLDKLRQRPDTPSSSSSSTSSDNESDNTQDCKRQEISAIVRDMMQQSRKKKSSKATGGNGVINRAAAVVEHFQAQEGDNDFEVMSCILEILDRVTMNLWVELIVKGQKASLDAFATFLRKRATEVTDDNFEESGRNTGGPGPCYCCKNYHKMFHCEFFRSRRVTNRWSMTKKSHLCSNCMQGRHPVRECKSMNNCKICNKRHNTILHVSMEAKAKARKARRMKAREVKKMAKEEAQGIVKSEAPAQPTGQSTDKAKSKNRWRKKTPNTKKNSNRNTPQEVQQ